MPAFGNTCRAWQEAAASGVLVPHVMRKCRSVARGTNLWPCSFIISCELYHVRRLQWFKQPPCIVNVLFRNKCYCSYHCKALPYLRISNGNSSIRLSCWRCRRRAYLWKQQPLLTVDKNTGHFTLLFLRENTPTTMKVSHHSR